MLEVSRDFFHVPLLSKVWFAVRTGFCCDRRPALNGLNRREICLEQIRVLLLGVMPMPLSETASSTSPSPPKRFQSDGVDAGARS
jgi:hypothetical protein